MFLHDLKTETLGEKLRISHIAISCIFGLPFVALPLLLKPFLSPEVFKPAFEMLAQITGYLGIIVVLLTFLKRRQLDIGSFSSHTLERSEFWPLIRIGFGSFACSIATYYLFYIPVSYVFPEFVEYVLNNGIELVTPDTANNYFGTASQIVALVVAAPIVEEIVFRGVILHRFTFWFGLNLALMLSSVIFAFFHYDFLGAILVTYILTSVYIRFGSLKASMIVHGAHNFFVLVFSYIERISNNDSTKYTVEEFQNEWPLCFIFTILAGTWCYNYFSTNRIKLNVRLPEHT